MISLRKHIAISLFGIFFYSIIFQSIHIVWHHSHGYKSECQLIDKETYDIDPCTFPKKIAQWEKKCPICEYKFSINDLPELSSFRSIIPGFTCSFKEIATQQHYKRVFLEKSPRAPPVLISRNNSL